MCTLQKPLFTFSTQKIGREFCAPWKPLGDWWSKMFLEAWEEGEKILPSKGILRFLLLRGLARSVVLLGKIRSAIFSQRTDVNVWAWKEKKLLYLFQNATLCISDHMIECTVYRWKSLDITYLNGRTVIFQDTRTLFLLYLRMRTMRASQNRIAYVRAEYAQKVINDGHTCPGRVKRCKMDGWMRIGSASGSHNWIGNFATSELLVLATPQ